MVQFLVFSSCQTPRVSRVPTMKATIAVRVFRGDQSFVAECSDLPAVMQGASLDELVANIKEAIALQLQGEDPADFGLARDASLTLHFFAN